MNNKYFNYLIKPKNGFVFLAVVLVSMVASSFKNETSSTVLSYSDPYTQEDSLLSKRAFAEVYKVLMSPRCMNCHPAGDVPLLGEDSKPHTQNVKRGPNGKGMYAVKCTNCHQEENTPGLNMPPGNPNWHMPPANMKMIFEGRTARQLAAQLLNPGTNGNKSKAQLVEHIVNDTLVLAGWHPGEGRVLPPLSHEEFTQQFKLWMDNGAYLPNE